MKKLTIINHALSELGMEAVTTISDSNAAAILGIKLSVLMPILLQSALWKFAIKFKSDKTPMQSQISPKFQYSYYLPNNYGRFFQNKLALNGFPSLSLKSSLYFNSTGIEAHLCAGSKVIS
jgi:hypothetical protein